VGGGPAGLSAALVLGRSGRRALLCDAGTPRNAAAHAMYAFLSRDGIAPASFRRAARAQLRRYPGVEVRDWRVLRAWGRDGAFGIEMEAGRRASGRKVLLATGLFDVLPPIEGIERFFGRSAFNCPYCDGWEMRTRPVAVYGRGTRGLEMARGLSAWTSDIVLFTDGPSNLGGRDRRLLARNGVRLEERRIRRLVGRNGRLQQVELQDGARIARGALFFDTPSYQQCELAASLGCRFTRDGGVRCGKYEATDVPGVYVAGNTIKDVHLAIVAAAEGAKAAIGINKALTREDFAKGRRLTRQRE